MFRKKTQGPVVDDKVRLSLGTNWQPHPSLRSARSGAEMDVCAYGG
jgi:hypothetical protein